MFIVFMSNGNFAVMDNTFNGAVFVAECESYDAATEMCEV